MENLNTLEFYKNIYDKLPVALFIADAQTGNIVEANNEASKLINLPRVEILKMHQSQLHPTIEDLEMRNRFNYHVEELTNKREVEPKEHFIVDSNEKLIPVEITPVLIKSENKNYIIGIFKDLSIEKERENFMYFYDKAMERSSTLIAFVDKNYIYKSVNLTFAKYFKANKTELIGKKIYEVLGNEHFNNVVKFRMDKALDGESVDYDTKFIFDGELKSFHIHYEPYFSIDEIITGVVVTAFDLTKVKEFEYENHKKEKLLIQQSKMASMGEMLENIAHQWRQPLSLISTCATGIKVQSEYGNLSDEILFESIDNITKTTNYLSNTINDFRNFFKRDKEKVEFSIVEYTNRALDLVSIDLNNNDIELIKEYKDDIKINSYSNEFIQVLLNILNNARDALLLSNKDKKIIIISIFKEEDNAIIEIKDNAGGIPNEIIDKVFEPYFTTKHKFQGTGIGLFMTREIIIKHMEGTIEVTNDTFSYNDNKYLGAQFRIVI